MEEGLSTYLEPLLRARRGRPEPRIVWAEFLRDMPQGLPRDGDQGLRRHSDLGRRYWGGALFWLHVDAVTPDLPALWSSLSVKADRVDRVTFDDLAPLAGIRWDLTQRSATRSGL